MGRPLRLLVIHDRAPVSAGLIALLKQRKDLRLIAEAGNTAAALKLVRKEKPDVVIMDLRSVAEDDLEAPKAVRNAWPKVRILMLTDNEESEVFAALAAEADGYCLKEAEFERLLTAIFTVASGEFWLDSAIAKKVVKALLDTMAILATELDDKVDRQADEFLSPRELEVLSLVSQGLSNPMIAQQLGISSETVKSHIRKVMKKLVVSDRTQAAVKALKKGLI